MAVSGLSILCILVASVSGDRVRESILKTEAEEPTEAEEETTEAEELPVPWSCPEACEECCYTGWSENNMQDFIRTSRKRFVCILKDSSMNGAMQFQIKVEKCNYAQSRTRGTCQRRQEGTANKNCLVGAECWFDTESRKNDALTAYNKAAYDTLDYCTDKVSCCCNPDDDWEEERCLAETKPRVKAESSKGTGTEEQWELQPRQSVRSKTCQFPGNEHHVYDLFSEAHLPDQITDFSQLPSRTEHEKVHEGCCLEVEHKKQVRHFQLVSTSGSGQYRRTNYYDHHDTWEWDECKRHEEIYFCGGNTPEPQKGADSTLKLYKRLPAEGEVTLGDCVTPKVSKFEKLKKSCQCSGSHLTGAKRLQYD